MKQDLQISLLLMPLGIVSVLLSFLALSDNFLKLFGVVVGCFIFLVGIGFFSSWLFIWNYKREMRNCDKRSKESAQ